MSQENPTPTPVNPPNPGTAPSPAATPLPADPAVETTAAQTVELDEKSRWELRRLATIAATATLAVLTGTPRIAETSVESPFRHGDPVTRVVPGAEKPPVIVVGGREVTVTTEQKTQKIDVAQELWARLFSDDEQAGKLTGQGELTQVRERIESLREQGYTITGVSLEGHASAEDDSVDSGGQRTAGLRTDDVENRRLGNKRARIFRGLVKDDLKTHDQSVPPVEITSPVEDMLSDSEVAQVRQLADKYGYGRVVTMIEDYNRGEEVSSEVVEVLDQLLAKERKVVVTIDAVRDKVFDTSVPTGDMIPGDTPPSVEIEPGGKSERIPIAIPLLLFLPIYRRRRETETPTLPPSTPPAGPPENLPTIPPVKPPRLPKRPGKTPEQPPSARRPRDAAFKERLTGGKSIERNQPATQRDKRPQESNWHGHKGPNRRQVQNRGGGRPAPRRSRGPRRSGR